MEPDYYISIYLDTRRKKKDNTYPVKLRVYSPNLKEQKLYSTKFSFTEKQFDLIWKSKNPRQENKEFQLKLRALEVRANAIAEKLNTFTFESFEKRLIRKRGVESTIHYNYGEKINDLKNQGKVGSAESYSNSETSIKKYIEEVLRKKYETYSLMTIDEPWLEKYEYQMTKVWGKSLATVGVYLRNLRAIFNLAIAEGDLNKDYYPFGKYKYIIPKVSKRKKALSKEALHKLYHSEPRNTEQEKAKDFWFFSYACNGMNMKDILLLNWSNISDNKIEFRREKTKTTTKGDGDYNIEVYLNDISLKVIEKYGDTGNSLVFPVLNNISDLFEQKKKIKNFTRFVNQHIKLLAKTIGITEDVSLQWARHSFTTSSIRNGYSMEFMKESLGHKNIKTTENYFAGFEDETKRKLSESLTKF